jgi:hypothetical protein
MWGVFTQHFCTLEDLKPRLRGSVFKGNVLRSNCAKRNPINELKRTLWVRI